jgi:hypothetical protein
MNTLSRLARAGTAVAVAALLVFTGSGAAQADALIDTRPSFVAGQALGTFGGSATPTYGQTITVPAGESSLANFSFSLSQGNGLVVRGQVYQWDATARRPLGAALFTSAPITLVQPSSTAFQTVTITTGGTPVVAGSQYVLLLTTLLDAQTGGTSARWAWTSASVYAGGYAAYSNSGTLATMQSTWDGHRTTNDYIFTAAFGPAPTVTSIAPSSGSADGGTSAVITGTNLTTATQVLFGTTPATSFVVNSPTQITAVAPAHAAKSVDVTVVTALGTSPATTGGVFTFIKPVVTSVSPSSGAVVGGGTVTISGSGLVGATSVTMGGAAAVITANSDTAITVTTPAHAAGVVPVVVTSPFGTATGSFTYVAAPVVTSIDPPTAALAGSTVTITGTDFTAATAVSFGDQPATGFTVDSATQITAVAPGQAAGTVDVVVTTPYGTSPVVAAGEYTYVDAPIVSDLSFTRSALAGGETVTITGTDLGATSAVDFGDVAATDVTVVSDTEITAVVPAQDAGVVDVVVTTAYGVSTAGAESSFRYVAAPTVTALSARSGSTVGGYAVTITGTDFTDATSVAFGSVAAARFTVISDTEITAIVAAAPAGVADVVVTTPFGVSAVTAAAEFTLVAPASVPAAIAQALAFTGVETAGVLAGGLALLIAGLGAFVVSRRRA